MDYKLKVEKVEKIPVRIGNKVILVSSSNTSKNTIGKFEVFSVRSQTKPTLLI